MIITWHRKAVSNIFHFYDDNEEIGMMKVGNFDSKVEAKLNSDIIEFEADRENKSKFHIYNLTSKENIGYILLGEISKAEIYLNDQKYLWENESIWGSRSSISLDNIGIIQYKNKTLKGKIQSEVKDEALVLSGFFVYNYYMQVRLGLVATFT